MIATKALACKLAKAAWYLMAEGTSYDPARMFGQPPKRNETLNLERDRQPVKGLAVSPED